MPVPATRSASIGVVCLIVALSFPGAAGATTPYVARPGVEYAHRGPPPLEMPTGVAVGADGTVFVVDGVNDRLLRFDSGGSYAEEIRQIGDQTLSRPISARFDNAGRLWVADSGNGRVLVRSADGTLDQVLTPSGGAGSHPPDITDAMPLSDGRRAWLVDNDQHRMILLDSAEPVQIVVGEEGQALRQFFHPFKLALGQNDDLLVVDVLNSRVQILTAQGQSAGSIGAYGAELGQLYRPTAVAVDRRSAVWIADAVLGVIQVFSSQGVLRDVLRDEAGAPLKFDMPMDLTFDADGRLYVVELRADRVRQFEVTFDSQAPQPFIPVIPQAQVGGQQARACTICHLEWMEPFIHGLGTALLPVPRSSVEQPAVSRSETCLSCHNGTVVDSRRRIWQAHGHATDVLPPPGMTVPEMLPLVGGRLACRTCHTAHAAGMPTGDLKTAVFLRVSGHAGQLCILCHPDKTRGPELGTHPTGGMPWPVPQVILDAGGRTGPNPRELTCRVCHTPHGAAHEHLLVMGTESNQLCRACHDELRPGMFREKASEHPLSPITTATQAAAVRELGTKLGPEGRLICLSCHKLHQGKSKRFMLAEALDDGRFCLRCHEERRILLGSSHDLRSNFPAEKNRLGMTPETGGPCSECHLFHRYARAPEFSDVDPGGGKCITCHQTGRVAQKKVLPALNHRGAVCTGCHDPHQGGDQRFLAGPPGERCYRCHCDKTGVLGGAHDIDSSPSAWPPSSAEANDPCLACHRPHAGEESGRWRAGFAPTAVAEDAVCAACHADASPYSGATTALVHPEDPMNLRVTRGLPLAFSPNGSWQMNCRSCHDPHAAEGRGAGLLRVDTEALDRPICSCCHLDADHITTIGHGPQSLHEAGFNGELCKPCHAVHGDARTIEQRFLWPQELAYQSQPGDTMAVANQYCSACHRAGGPVPPPAIATHPRADFFNPTVPGAPGFLPLFNDRGEVDPQGHHACRTCHLTHGRATPAPLAAELGPISSRELRARRWHLRAFEAGNVCTTCHGFDALRRFMYFHDPARRGGPLEGGATTAVPAR